MCHVKLSFFLVTDDFVKIGDMTFIKHELATDRERRNAITNLTYSWPDAVIPYSISSRFEG